MGSLRTDLWREKSSMNALIAEPIAKLIMALLIGIGIYFGIKHYNGLNQKIGRLETVLEEKQDLIDAQNQNFISLKKQVTEQAEAISSLQRVQEDLKQNSEQRKINIQEIINNDQDAKTWAAQPVPDHIRRLFNNTQASAAK